MEVANSGLVKSASNFEQRATRRIQWHPQILLRRTSRQLCRNSSENMYKAIVGSWRCKPLPSKSVSDNVLVVQLSMAHLKVWRWLECLYFRLAIELCALQTEQKGADQIKHSCQMNSFRHAFKMSHKKCNAKFSYRTQYHLPISKLFASSVYFQQKNIQDIPGIVSITIRDWIR